MGASIYTVDSGNHHEANALFGNGRNVARNGSTYYAVYSDGAGGGGGVNLSVSTDIGQNWSEEVVDAAGSQASCAVDSSGVLHVVYIKDVTGNDQVFHNSRTEAGVWQGATQLTTASSAHQTPIIAVDTNDYLHVVYRDGSGDLYYRLNNGSWQSAEGFGTSGGLRPAIAVDSNSYVHVLFALSAGASYYIWHTMRSGSWSTPVRISALQDHELEFDCAVDSSDNLHCVFYNTTVGTLYYKQRASGGSWGSQSALTNGGRYPAISLDSNDNIYVLSIVSGGGTTNVYLNKYSGSWASSQVVSRDYTGGASLFTYASSLDALYPSGQRGESGWFCTWVGGPSSTTLIECGVDDAWPGDLPNPTSCVPSWSYAGVTRNVQIGGDHFTGATAVSFGAGVTVNSFTVTSDVLITANITLSEIATVGNRNIQVTTPAGSSTLTSGFAVRTYWPASKSYPLYLCMLTDGAFTPFLDTHAGSMGLEGGSGDVTGTQDISTLTRFSGVWFSPIFHERDHVFEAENENDD